MNIDALIKRQSKGQGAHSFSCYKISSGSGWTRSDRRPVLLGIHTFMHQVFPELLEPILVYQYGV